MNARIPPTMAAIEIPAPGGPEVLRLTRRTTPVPGPGEALIQVAAAGVNRLDVMQRQGRYPAPPGASDIPGVELAGMVVSVGEDVASLRVGDRVCALVAGGGYAEYCVAPAAQCLPTPGGSTSFSRRASRKRSSQSGPTSLNLGALPQARVCCCTEVRAGLARPRFNWPMPGARASLPLLVRRRNARRASNSAPSGPSTIGLRISFKSFAILQAEVE